MWYLGHNNVELMDCTWTGRAVDIAKHFGVYVNASQNQAPPVCGRVVIEETEAAWLTGPRYFIARDLFNCYVCTPLHPRTALTPGFGRSRGSRGVVETCYSTAGNRVMQKLVFQRILIKQGLLLEAHYIYNVTLKFCMLSTVCMYVCV